MGLGFGQLGAGHTPPSVGAKRDLPWCFEAERRWPLSRACFTLDMRTPRYSQLLCLVQIKLAVGMAERVIAAVCGPTAAAPR